MWHRITFLVMCLFILAPSAPAMETNAKKDAPPNNEIEMPFLICPATQDGKLVGYFYISYRMVTPSAEEARDIKGKLATLQDTYVRAVYRHDVFKEGHPNEFDQQAFQTIILNATRGMVKADQVTGITIKAIKYEALHPRGVEAPAAPPVDNQATAKETKDSAHKKPAGH